MNPFDLTGKVAIVTGGNGGIGLGMATGLYNAGATVVISADVTKKAQCWKLVAQTVKKCGRLDILVNNAGIAVRKFPRITPRKNGTG